MSPPNNQENKNQEEQKSSNKLEKNKSTETDESNNVEISSMKKEGTDIGEIKEYVTNSYPDEIYKYATIGLITIALVCIITIAIYAWSTTNVQPEGLVAIASAAVGGLVGVFSKGNR